MKNNIIKILSFVQIRITSEDRYSIELNDQSHIFKSNLKYNEINEESSKLKDFLFETDKKLQNVKNKKEIIDVLSSEIDSFIKMIESENIFDNELSLDIEEDEFEEILNENRVFNISEKNEKLVQEVVDSIEVVNNENDKRFTWHWKYKWSSLIKWHSKEDIEEQKRDIWNSIREMIENWEVISILKSSSWDKENYYWIANTKEALYDLKFNWHKDRTIDRNHLVEFFKKPNFVRAEYVLTKDQYEEVLTKLENEFWDEEYQNKLKSFNVKSKFISYIKNLEFNKIKFTQDSYFKEIEECYSDMIEEEIRNEYTKWNIKWFWTIQLWINDNWEISIIEWSHRVIALMNIHDMIYNWKLKFFDIYKKRFDLILNELSITSKSYINWVATRNDLSTENIQLVDSIDNEEIKVRIKKKVSNEIYELIMRH